MSVSSGYGVLLVDDDPLFLEQVSTLLAHNAGMRVAKASSGKELFESLDTTPVDCIVLDNDLGHESGLAIGERIMNEIDCAPPIVMLTGTGSERAAVKAFRGGFSNYVPKQNFRIGELVDAISGAVETRRAEAADLAEKRRLQEQANVHEVSGLWSASYLSAHMQDLFGESVPFAVIAVKLRGLAEVRLRIGRTVVDRVTGQFATRFTKAAGRDVVAGHVSGDTYACVATGDQAGEGLAAFRDALRQEVSFVAVVDRTEIRVAPIIGVGRSSGACGYQSALESAVEEIARASPEPDGSVAGDMAGEPAPADTFPASLIEQKVERRRERRQRVLKRGKIMTGDRDAVLDCTIRNLSSSGARLRVDDFFAPPPAFSLAIVGEGGSPRRVELRWQIGPEMGVEFVEPAS